jgi:hypothetical protein
VTLLVIRNSDYFLKKSFDLQEYRYTREPDVCNNVSRTFRPLYSRMFIGQEAG